MSRSPESTQRASCKPAALLQRVLRAGRTHARGANAQRKMLLTNAVAALAVLNLFLIAPAFVSVGNWALDRAAISMLPGFVPFVLTIELNRRGRSLAASWCLLLGIPLVTMATIVAGLGTVLTSHVFLFVAAAIAPILLPVQHRKSLIVFALTNLSASLYLHLQGWPPHPAMFTVAPWIVDVLTGYLIAAALTSLLVVVMVTEYWASTNEAELGAQALCDSLTGLPNRRAFQHEVERELERARRQQSPLAVAMIDIDHFKQINDRHGHAVGDAVLRRLSEVLGGAMRSSDLLARWGGEEFIVLVADTDLPGASNVLERLRLAVAEAHFPLAAGQTLNVTVSVGLTALPADSDLDASLVLADQALYAAKAAGRNQTRMV